jgi:hypothetical protein
MMVYAGMGGTLQPSGDTMMTHQSEISDQRRWPRGLVVLNVALLTILGVVSITPQVDAQSSPINMRVRGDYSVVGGKTLGENASTIFVLDSENRELVSLRWNDSTKAIEGVGFRDLVRDVNSDPDR